MKHTKTKPRIKKTLRRFEYERIEHDGNVWNFDGKLLELATGKRELRVSRIDGPVRGSLGALCHFIEHELGGENVRQVRAAGVMLDTTIRLFGTEEL